MKVKWPKEKRIDIVFALFWRYGYWFSFIAVLYLIGTPRNGYLLFGGGAIIYGIYTIVISIKPARHFLLGMLDVEHKKMELTGSGYRSRLSSWRRDAWFLGLFFGALGGLIVWLGFMD